MLGVLTNKRIALAETRELDLLAEMLTRDGAAVIRCPMVSILDTPDPAPVEAWISRVIDGQCDDVLFYTGEGPRRLVGFADRAGFKDKFIAALGRCRKITRGPKPVRALREIGLEPDLTAAAPTTDGLITTLSGHDLRGRTVGLQIYGQEPNEVMVTFLQEKGARVDIVAPYIYAPRSEADQVRSLIDRMAGGEVDVIAFTSSPQLKRMVEVAKSDGITEMLKRGLERTKVAAVGPVVAGELTAMGRDADVVAAAPFSLKPLVRAIAQLVEKT